MTGNEYPISRVRMYLTLLVVNSFLTIFRLLIVKGESTTFHIAVSIASLAGFLGLWEFILFFGKILEKAFPVSSHPNKRIIIQVLATWILATAYGEFLFNLSINLFNVQFPPSLQEIGYLLYFLLSVVLNLIYFGTIYFFNWKKDLTHLADIEREQAIVRYHALLNQLNPHFLFNALTSLNSLIFDNQQLASDFLKQLSKIYRYVLQHKEKETVTLTTELEFVDSYVFLLKTRFANAIEFDIQSSDLAREKKIVPVTLQILIENAIKHNVVCTTYPLKISITTNESHMIVENNVSKKDLIESSNKQGLKDLKSLYAYLTELPIEISGNDKKFSIKIPLL
jgi:two-component system, LytTR family, sensor kinase